MNTILNHQNQQNLPYHTNISQHKTGHPSLQSQPKPFKPSIKVGYKVVESAEKGERRFKKPILIAKPDHREKIGVKKVITSSHQAQSGNFIHSEYIPKHPEKSEVRFHKRAVEDAHQKYHSGREFSHELRNQFVSKNRSSRSITERSSIATERRKLSGYKNEGIKDIMQYHYAGNYRQCKVSNKCNNEKVKQRLFRFSDIHDLDFRRLKGQF